MQTTQLDQVSFMILLKGYLNVTLFSIFGLMSCFMLADASNDLHLLLRVDENTAFRHFVGLVDLFKARELANFSILARSGAG